MAEQERFEPKGKPIVSFPVDIKHWQVIPFAKAMDDVLTKNDHKGGWRDCTKQYLRYRLVEEMGEYFRLIATEVENRGIRARELEQKELLDIANFCMMLWDRS